MSGNVRIAIAALMLSAVGLVGIVSHEGYTDRAAIPVAGDKPTLGFGSTTRADGSPVQLGDKTTPPAALSRALDHIEADESGIKACVHVPLHQYEYDAYVSLAYNIGVGAFCRSILVKRLNTEDYEGACDEIPRWRFYQGKDCSQAGNRHLCGGIWSRRQAEHLRCLGETE